MRMIRQDAMRSQRVADVLALWMSQEDSGVPTLARLDPVGNAPAHVGWMLLINRDGSCRLAGTDAEVFLDRYCKGMLAATIFCGKAGAVALDAVSAALGAGRPQLREIQSDKIEFAVAAAPYAADTNSPEGVLLTLSTDALTLKTLNAALEAGPALEVVSRVA